MLQQDINYEHRALVEAIRNLQAPMGHTIGRITEIMMSLPEGEARARLLDEISNLDVISEVMKRAVELSESE